MSCPQGAQELRCSAYYITELQRKKLVKNETNFRWELLFQSPGSHACIFSSSRSCLFLSLRCISQSIFYSLRLSGWTSCSPFFLCTLVFYDGNSCSCRSSWTHSSLISNAPSISSVWLLFLSPPLSLSSCLLPPSLYHPLYHPLLLIRCLYSLCLSPYHSSPSLLIHPSSFPLCS